MKSGLKQIKLNGDSANEHKILSRERLNCLLLDNIDKNVIFIYAPPGYGKTTLVKDFLNYQSKQYIELYLKDDIDFVYTFFIRLVEALRKLNKNFGKFTIQIIESRRQRYQLSNKMKNVIEDVVSTFYNECKIYFNDEVYLVLEDLHNLKDLFLFEESKWAIQTFNSLLNKIPENLHLIITTRQLPDLNFTQLIIKDKLLKLGIEDLKFQNEEIKELLEYKYGIEYSDNDIKLLKENLGGWITGINMLLQTFGKDFKKVQLDYQKIPENTFNFLAEGIFIHLDSKIQNFLLSTALLDDFSYDICNSIMNIKNSNSIISDLKSKNLFIHVKSKNGNSLQADSYQYQLLFKRFLISKLYEIYSDEHIKLLITKIYNYYKANGDIVSALNYLMLTNDFKKAIPVIIKNFQHLFNEGKFEFLWKWLSSFDKETYDSNPYLLYYLGILYKYFIGDLETSLSYLETAITKLKESKNHQTLLKCYINKAGVLINLGNSREALQEISKLFKYHNTPENKANLLYFSGYAHYQNADYDISIKCLEDSLRICEEEKFDAIKTHIYNLMGHMCLIKGEYTKAIKYYEWIVENDVNVIDKFETICNLILLFSQSGRIQKSQQFMLKLEELVKQFPSPIFKIPYLLSKQAYLFESGDYHNNIKVLDEINSIAVSMNHKKYIYLSHRLMIDTYYYTNDSGKFDYHYSKALEYLEKDNELEKIEMTAVKALQLKKSNLDTSIETALKDALVYYETNNFHYSKAQICFHLGDYYYKMKNKEKSLYYLNECFKICREKDYISYLQRELRYSKELIKFASANNVYKEFLFQL